MAVRQTSVGRVTQMMKAMSGSEEKEGLKDGKVAADIDRYNAMHDDSKMDAKERSSAYAELVNSYYNLATDFYEWGWGQSFHCAEKLAANPSAVDARTSTTWRCGSACRGPRARLRLRDRRAAAQHRPLLGRVDRRRDDQPVPGEPRQRALQAGAARQVQARPGRLPQAAVRRRVVRPLLLDRGVLPLARPEGRVPRGVPHAQARRLLRLVRVVPHRQVRRRTRHLAKIEEGDGLPDARRSATPRSRRWASALVDARDAALDANFGGGRGTRRPPSPSSSSRGGAPSCSTSSSASSVSFAPKGSGKADAPPGAARPRRRRPDRPLYADVLRARASRSEVRAPSRLVSFEYRRLPSAACQS